RIHRIERMRLELSRHSATALLTNRIEDGSALGERTRRDVQIAEHVIVLGAFVSHDLGDAAGADDQDVLFHSRESLLRLLTNENGSLRRDSPRNPRNQTCAVR